MGTTGGVARQTGSGVVGNPLAQLQADIKSAGKLTGEHLRRRREIQAQQGS
jgi:hypothetical protein